jgi:hypothetical protein
MGTMSVDFIVMGDCRRSYRKSPNHAFRADRKGCSSKKRLTREGHAQAPGVNGRHAGGVKGSSRSRRGRGDPTFDAALINRMLTIRAKTAPL